MTKNDIFSGFEASRQLVMPNLALNRIALGNLKPWLHVQTKNFQFSSISKVYVRCRKKYLLVKFQKNKNWNFSGAFTMHIFSIFREGKYAEFNFRSIEARQIWAAMSRKKVIAKKQLFFLQFLAKMAIKWLKAQIFIKALETNYQTFDTKSSLFKLFKALATF